MKASKACLKFDEMKMLFNKNKKKMKLGLKFNPELVLIDL